MGRKKSPASDLDVREKTLTPLAQRLGDLITDANELREHLGVTMQAVNQYKLGLARPSLENLCKIADFYGTTTDFLLGRSEVKSQDATVQAATTYTGLSEKAATILHQLKYDVQGCPKELGVTAKGYTVGHVGLVSSLLESRDCLELFNQIGLYLVYGGALPEDAYISDEKMLSLEEHERFYRWANGRGLEVIPRKEVSELHLQLACEKLKSIFRDVLKENTREG